MNEKTLKEAFKFFEDVFSNTDKPIHVSPNWVLVSPKEYEEVKHLPEEEQYEEILKNRYERLKGTYE